MAFRLRDRLGGLDEHDVGGAPHGLEFSVEGDAADAIDADDASAPNKAKHEFRVADEGEGLPDHNATSAASSMNGSSPVKRDWHRGLSPLANLLFSQANRARVGLRARSQKGGKAQKIGREKQAPTLVRPH